MSKTNTGRRLPPLFNINQSIIIIMKSIYKTPQTAVNTRQINAICNVKTECGEVREIPKSVIVTDASRANVQAELAKEFKGILLSFRVSRISAVYG